MSHSLAERGTVAVVVWVLVVAEMGANQGAICIQQSRILAWRQRCSSKSIDFVISLNPHNRQGRAVTTSTIQSATWPTSRRCEYGSNPETSSEGARP